MSEDLSPSSRAVPARFSVLLVDDDEIDVRQFQRCYRRAGYAEPLSVTHDGQAALDWLQAQLVGDCLAQPVLLILDVRMPQMSGLECLAEVRADRRMMPVIPVMMSTSDDPDDVRTAFELHTAAYLLKRDFGEALSESLDILMRFARLSAYPQ